MLLIKGKWLPETKILAIPPENFKTIPLQQFTLKPIFD